MGDCLGLSTRQLITERWDARLLLKVPGGRMVAPTVAHLWGGTWSLPNCCWQGRMKRPSGNPLGSMAYSLPKI
eukprot:366260-Chlamydomonas_euryale.AAC.2